MGIPIADLIVGDVSVGMMLPSTKWGSDTRGGGSEISCSKSWTTDRLGYPWGGSETNPQIFAMGVGVMLPIDEYT